MLTEKKLRGVPRRLRALKRWAEEFSGHFPSTTELALADQYYNWKVPVDLNLVEGAGTSREIQRVCAQALVDACGKLLKSKPVSARGVRVTCVVCLPDMFTSEVCIYLDENYFSGYTTPCSSKHGTCTHIVGRRLSEEWGLHLPQSMGELGVALDYRGFDDKDHWFVGERWYFGEVAALDNSSFDVDGYAAAQLHR